MSNITPTPPETPRAKRGFPRAAELLARLEFAAADRSPLARWRPDFPTAVALLEHLEKPWASRLERFALTRLALMYSLGFDILELGPPPWRKP